jgi:hypothetical protein
MDSGLAGKDFNMVVLERGVIVSTSDLGVIAIILRLRQKYDVFRESDEEEIQSRYVPLLEREPGSLILELRMKLAEWGIALEQVQMIADMSREGILLRGTGEVLDKIVAWVKKADLSKGQVVFELLFGRWERSSLQDEGNDKNEYLLEGFSFNSEVFLKALDVSRKCRFVSRPIVTSNVGSTVSLDWRSGIDFPSHKILLTPDQIEGDVLSLTIEIPGEGFSGEMSVQNHQAICLSKFFEWEKRVGISGRTFLFVRVHLVRLDY